MTLNYDGLNFGDNQTSGLDFGTTYDFGQGLNRFEKYDLKTQTDDFFKQNSTVDQTSLFSLQQRLDDITERQVIYYFDVIKGHKVQLQSQITDYWLENNTAVQDTICINPIIINLTGLVGEVVFNRPTNFTDFLTAKLNSLFPSNTGFTLTQKLGKITSLVPAVDNYTQLAKNAINYIETAYNRYKKVYDTFQNWRKGTTSTTKSKQQQIYETFERFWVNKTPLIVNTPYGVFESMYIQNVTMEQGDTNTVSNISVTLKQLTFATVKYTKADPSVFEKYNGQAQAPTENVGQSKSNQTSARKVLEYLKILPKEQKHNRPWKK